MQLKKTGNDLFDHLSNVCKNLTTLIADPCSDSDTSIFLSQWHVICAPEDDDMTIKRIGARESILMKLECSCFKLVKMLLPVFIHSARIIKACLRELTKKSYSL
jgi:hypothetical protein